VKHRGCPRRFRAKKCAGGIHTDVLDVFPHAQTNTDGCRRVQSDQVMKNPYHYDNNIRIHGADKNLGKECFLVGINAFQFEGILVSPVTFLL